MNKRKISKMFKSALQGQSIPPQSRDAERIPVSPDSAYIAKMDEMIEMLDEYTIDYSLTVQEDEPQDQDHIIELEHYRAEFFSNLQKAAGLINASMSDICAASNCNYQDIWDNYATEADDFNDDDLIRVSTYLYDELKCLKDSLISGYREQDSRISYFIDAKPIEDYIEDPEAITP